MYSKFHPESPPGAFYVWDGNSSSPLHKEGPEMYDQYMGHYRDSPFYNLVIKIGSECLVHRGNRMRTEYSINRVIDEVQKARSNPDIMRVMVVYSGACTLGRTERNRQNDPPRQDALEDRRRNAQHGEPVIKAMITSLSRRKGDKPTFVDVRPQDYIMHRKDVVSECVELMDDGFTVWMNEKDADRKQENYGDKTFNENDMLASMTAQELSSVLDIGGRTALVYLMDQMGILPYKYVQQIRHDAQIVRSTGGYQPLQGGGRGKKDLNNIIAVVANPKGIESEVFRDVSTPPDEASETQQRITRGGLNTKINAGGKAAENGVATWISSGMWCIHDSKHMTNKKNTAEFIPVSAILDRRFTGTHFLPSDHPLYTNDL